MIYKFIFYKVHNFVEHVLQARRYAVSSQTWAIISLIESLNLTTVFILVHSKNHILLLALMIIIGVFNSAFFTSEDRYYKIIWDKRWESFDKGFVKYLANFLLYLYAFASIFLFFYHIPNDADSIKKREIPAIFRQHHI